METTENIWREYQSRLTAFIRSRVADDAVDDLLQNVFLKIHTHIDSLKTGTKLESWLYQITRNAVIDYYRTRRVSVRLPESVEQPQPVEAHNVKKELATCLEPMVRELPGMYCDAIRLSAIDNETQQEVAERQGISLSGAKSRIQRGRALLRSMLDDCCAFEINHKNQVLSYDKKQKDCKFC